MKKFEQINVIPFIDIMLVLLAIVLTTATFIAQGKIPLDLPKAENSQPLDSHIKAVSISINAEEKLFWDDQPLDLTTLENKLADSKLDQPYQLRVDGKTPFKSFVQVIDLFKKYDLEQLAIVTEKAQ